MESGQGKYLSGEVLFEKLFVLISMFFCLVKFWMLLKVKVYDSPSQENMKNELSKKEMVNYS
jgi:hypothetical protein